MHACTSSTHLSNRHTAARVKELQARQLLQDVLLALAARGIAIHQQDLHREMYISDTMQPAAGRFVLQHELESKARAALTTGAAWHNSSGTLYLMNWQAHMTVGSFACEELLLNFWCALRHSLDLPALGQTP